MPKANVNIKIDANIKELATQVLARMGLDQTTAIDMFYRQIITECRLPFQPVASPTLEEQVVKAALARNPKRIKLDVDKDGNILVDKDKHPEIYDWAVNG